MKMALEGNTLRIREMSDLQYQQIRALNRFKWVRATKEINGIVDLDTLDRLATICHLPEPIETYRLALQRRQEAIDKLRLDKSPKLIIKPPVKAGIKPYTHQIRAFIMALVTFGVIDPAEVLKNDK